MHFSQTDFGLKEPVLASLLESRTTGLVIVGAAALHGALLLADLPGWQCPVRHTLGIPCPGCGLSRAISALAHGDWHTAILYHAFAPLFLGTLLFIAGALLLPNHTRASVTGWIARLEKRTGITAILLVAFVIYWLARLLFYREAFINLILG